jgi:hypothetical protein
VGHPFAVLSGWIDQFGKELPDGVEEAAEKGRSAGKRPERRPSWAKGRGDPPALPGWQSSFDIYGSGPGFCVFPSCFPKENAPSLRDSGSVMKGDAHPTLKRGANQQCASGAGFHTA